MNYKVTIDSEGLWTTNVINAGVHKCADIVQTIGSFGEIVETQKKKDDVPVNIHVERTA
jgi:hypothetical protein